MKSKIIIDPDLVARYTDWPEVLVSTQEAADILGVFKTNMVRSIQRGCCPLAVAAKPFSGWFNPLANTKYYWEADVLAYRDQVRRYGHEKPGKWKAKRPAHPRRQRWLTRKRAP